MNGVKTTDLDLVGGAVAAFLAESDKSAFAAGLQRLIDTDALALVSEHCLLDIPLFWVVRGGRPPVELAERFLGFLFRHQDRHLWSGAGEKLLRHFLIRVFGCDPNSFEDGDTEGLPQSAGTDYWFISR